jgi:predicted phage terminase large subunit-like protein
MNSDLQFLIDLDLKILVRYIDNMSMEDRNVDEVRLLRWKMTQEVPQNELSALKFHVKALQKLTKTNEIREKVTQKEPETRELTPIEIEKRWIEAAREDVGAFIEYVRGQALARHHKIWLANIFDPDRKRINIIAPRDSAKSTIAVYALAFQIGSAPLSTSCLISVSAAQTEERLAMVHGIISENIRFKNVFPHIEIDKNKPDNMNQFSVRVREDMMPYNEWRTLVEQKGSPKDPTVFATGYGGKGVIGRRFSGILLIDDIVDETMLSGDAQEKVRRYIMQTLIPCVKEEGRVVVIGTRWMIGDVPQLLSETKHWYTITIPAILYRDGKAYSYWPEYWPMAKLQQRREEIGELLFRIMYLCDPQANSIEIFTREMLDVDLPRTDSGTLNAQLTAVYISTDFAISVKQSADWTVFAAIGVDRENNFYVLDMRRIKEDEKKSPRTLADFALEIANRYNRLDNILIEKVGFQSAMGTILSTVAPGLPYLAVVPKGDKAMRARIVADVAARNQLFINQRIAPDILKQLKDEWLYFGTHPHDDTLDPVSLCMQHLGVQSTLSATLHIVRSPFML